MAILEVMNDIMVGGDFFGVLVSCRSSFLVDGYVFFFNLGDLGVQTLSQKQWGHYFN